MHRRSVAIVVFEDVQGLDVLGPADVFSFAGYVLGDRSAYEVELVGDAVGPITTASGPRLVVDRPMVDPDLRPDVLLPPLHAQVRARDHQDGQGTEPVSQSHQDLGHLRAAEEVRQVLSLDRVLFVPSRIPPHKHTDPDDPIADSARRLRWVERAIAGHPDFSVDRVEIEREGPSFLVDTLATIRGRDGTGTAPPPVFIVGQDAFAEMGDWRAPERIFALADLAVMTRPPGHLRHLADRLPAIVRDDYDIAADVLEKLRDPQGVDLEERAAELAVEAAVAKAAIERRDQPDRRAAEDPIDRVAGLLRARWVAGEERRREREDRRDRVARRGHGRVGA